MKSKMDLPPDFPSKDVEQAYLHPEVDPSSEQFSWEMPDLHAIRVYHYNYRVMHPTFDYIKICTEEIRIGSGKGRFSLVAYFKETKREKNGNTPLLFICLSFTSTIGQKIYNSKLL